MMARKSRNQSGRQSLKRKVAIRPPRKTLLVFCEGERTEPEYLRALKGQPFVRDVAAVDLRVEPRHEGAVPLALVSMAAGARSKAINEEAEIDEFWCIFDVEWPVNHPNLDDALDLARRNDIQLAISNYQGCRASCRQTGRASQPGRYTIPARQPVVGHVPSICRSRAG
jgi:hypothetical protein